MPDKAFILPRGYDPRRIPPRLLEELHRAGPSEENAQVVLLDAGVEVFRAPFSHELAHKLEAKIPPITVRTQEGVEVLGEPRLELKPGASPLLQLIRPRAGTLGVTRKEIHDLVFDEFRWLRKEHRFRGWLDGFINKMARDGYLIRAEDETGEHFHEGYRRLNLVEGRGYDAEPGEYPVVKLIRDTVSEKGVAELKEISDTVFNKWKWVERRGAVKFWVDYGVREGYLREAGANRYEAGGVT